MTAGINFPSQEQIENFYHLNPTWKPCSATQAEGRILRNVPMHKKRRNQTLNYHLRIQKKWNKRWKEPKRVPVIHWVAGDAVCEKTVTGRLSSKQEVINDMMSKMGYKQKGN